MRKFRTLFIIASCCALFGVACGDETEGTTDTGGGTDVENDMGGDVTNDIPEADTTEDTGGGEDTTEDTTEDTGGGEDTTEDTGEPDLGPTDECVPAECDGECRGGICVEEISAEDYEAALVADPASYFSSLQLPSLYPEPEDCCFDFTGDGEPDNGLGLLLGLLTTFAADVDAQALIDEAIADGDVVLLAHWMELPEGFEGDARFAINLGDTVNDEEGNPVDDFETRAAGDGNFVVSADSIDEFGPQVQFNTATIEDGILTAGPSAFVLTLPLTELLGSDLVLQLDSARIRAEITEEETGIFTVDETRTGADGDFEVSGGQLGGALEATQLLSVLDGLFRDCDCGGIDPEEPVLTYTLDLDTESFIIACNPDNNGSGTPACTDEDGTLCGNFSLICGGALAALGSVFDVDQRACTPVDAGATECGSGADSECECTAGQDGVFESLSVGIRFGLSGATVEGFEASAE
jgi:hypothetical protein